MISIFQRETLRFDSIPKDLEAKAIDKRQELIEAVTNVDNELGELYLAEKTPTNDELIVS